jgi:Uncharacterised nucleotidyltransferase
MQIKHSNSSTTPLSKRMRLREAVLMTFCNPVHTDLACLLHLSRKQWQDLLHWLDTSGLALYFLDRLQELELLDILPIPVRERLERNLFDNSQRLQAMIAESSAIQLRFQHAGLSYAVMKGFSLTPLSVPKLELRSQLDLDFFIADTGATEARLILEDFGYRLHAISGKTWEFKATEGAASSIRELYKPGASRSVELHLESPGAQPPLLSRTQRQCFHSVCMPVLSPTDLFVGQALHLCKHICSEFVRAAHLIEFHRHIIARRHDSNFWKQLHAQASQDRSISIRLGIAVQLVSRILHSENASSSLPEALTRWTSGALPLAVRRCVDVYGSRIVLADFPGNKLYLLLQKELEASGIPANRSLRQALLPLRMPPRITPSIDGESPSARLLRQRKQLSFLFFRLRFHTTEGLRFLHESMLWRQTRNELSR